MKEFGFEEAVEIILEHEKGYVNHPKDPGGETNWGISKRQYPNLDIKNLTRAEAIQIYLADYWTPVRADQLPVGLRLLAFDCAVNQGVHTAIEVLQESVGAKVDGHLGPLTLEAVRKCDPKLCVGMFAYLRWRKYSRNPRWPSFGSGWSKRLLDVAVKSALMA